MNWSLRMSFFNGEIDRRTGATHRTNLLGTADMNMDGEFPPQLYYPPALSMQSAYHDKFDIVVSSSLWGAPKTPDARRVIDLDVQRIFLHMGAEDFENEKDFRERVEAYRSKGWKIEAQWREPPARG